jgi:hypothetical protein
MSAPEKISALDPPTGALTGAELVAIVENPGDPETAKTVKAALSLILALANPAIAAAVAAAIAAEVTARNTAIAAEATLRTAADVALDAAIDAEEAARIAAIAALVIPAIATAAEVRTGTNNTKAVSPAALVGAAVPQVLADGATVNWDMASGFNARVTLGGNRTLAAPTNFAEGVTYALGIIQDGTGTRTLTWNAAFDFGSAGAPTLSTAAGKRDLVFLYCYDATVGAPKFRCSFNKSA